MFQKKTDFRRYKVGMVNVRRDRVYVNADFTKSLQIKRGDVLGVVRSRRKAPVCKEQTTVAEAGLRRSGGGGGWGGEGVRIEGRRG